MNETPAQQGTRPPHWGVLATLAWSVPVAFAFLALQVAALIAVIRLAWFGVPPGRVEDLMAWSASNGSMIAFSSVVTAILCTAMVAGIIKLKKGAKLRDYLALNPVPARTLAKWVGFTVVFIAAGDFLTYSLGRSIVPEFMLDAYATAQPALFWAALVVAAPLFEETFFRGFLFRGLEASVLGATGTVIVTALLWTIIHVQYDVYWLSHVLVAGLLLGAARVATRSLYVPIAMHATLNFVATLETVILLRA